jgi:hypothetical protein
MSELNWILGERELNAFKWDAGDALTTTTPGA